MTYVYMSYIQKIQDSRILNLCEANAALSLTQKNPFISILCSIMSEKHFQQQQYHIITYATFRTKLYQPTLFAGIRTEKLKSSHYCLRTFLWPIAFCLIHFAFCDRKLPNCTRTVRQSNRRTDQKVGRGVTPKINASLPPGMGCRAMSSGRRGIVLFNLNFAQSKYL